MFDTQKSTQPRLDTRDVSTPDTSEAVPIRAMSQEISAPLPFPATPSQKRKHKKLAWILPLSIVGVLMLGAGGVFAAYKMGYVQLPILDKYFAPSFSLPAYVERFFDATQSKQKVDVSFSFADRKPETPIFDINPKDEAVTFLSSMMPTDLQASVSVASELSVAENKVTSGTAKLEGSYTTSGTQLSVDVEARVVDEISYVRVDKFPSLFFLDASAISGKWIRLDPQEILSFAPTVLPSVSGDVSQIENTGLDEAARSVISHTTDAIISSGIIRVKQSLKEESIDGVSYKRVALEVVPEQTENFINRLAQNLSNQCATSCPESIASLSAQLANTQEKQIIVGETLNFFTFLQKHAQLIVGFTESEQQFFSIEFVGAFPVSVEKFANKELHAMLKIFVEPVSSVKEVIAPVDALSVNDAYSLMFGLTEEQIQAAKQIENVSALRSALAQYQEKEKTYPDSLDGFTDLVLIDTYTSTKFVYEKVGTGYTLIFTMPDMGIEVDLLMSSSESFVAGKNTADAYVFSREYEADKDSDGDGLTGAQELQYKTNPRNPDTDGDNKDDFTEVQEGTDPLTSNVGMSPENTNTNAHVNSSGDGLVIIPENSLQPNTGRSNGGTKVKIGFRNAINPVVTFGDRRAYVVEVADTYIEVISPSIASPAQIGALEQAQVIVTTDGVEKNVDPFLYAGEVFVDTDIDGLADQEEIAIGTDKTKQDSDGDGHSDFTETNSGYNPLVHAYDDVTLQIAPEMKSLFTGSEGSISFWARSHDWAAQENKYMITFIDQVTSAELFLVRKNAGYLSVTVDNDVGTGTWSANDISWQNDTWMFFVLNVKEGERPKLFVDGRELSGFISHQHSLVMTSALIQKLRVDGMLYMQGRKAYPNEGMTHMSDIVIDQKILTPDDIQERFAKGISDDFLDWN